MEQQIDDQICRQEMGVVQAIYKSQKYRYVIILEVWHV